MGTHNITVTATDVAGNSASCVVALTVVDQAGPAFACPNPVQFAADENGQAQLPNLTTAIVASDCSGPVDVTQSPPAGTTLNIGTHSVLITATDALGNAAACTVAVTVSAEGNTPPVVTIEQPASGFLSPIGQPVQLAGTFTDDGPAGTHTAEWIVSSAALPATPFPATVSAFTVSGAIQFPEPGVYSIKLVVTDSQGASGEATKVSNDLPAYGVIYDPNGGFVTGGGWIWSPPGALHPGLEDFAPIEGKATFGFVSKYKKGAIVPTGQTEFQFHAGDLNFHSASYQWLVVAGARAQFKGTGTINGGGNFGFLLTAIDGQISGGGGIDRFRIKIWDTESGVIVYDNQPGTNDDAELDDTTVLRAGSIVIHRK